MSEKKSWDFLNGETLLIDKPYEWTSFDVVNKLRYTLKKLLGVKKLKVGHAGTLDPLATGLLILCTGKSTKQIHELQGLDKQYDGTMFLGGTTPSYDRETEIDQVFPTEHLTGLLLKQTAEQFTGTIQQTPPAFSAVKVGGTASYHHARKGREVAIQPRQIIIYSFEILKVEMPLVKFRVHCSKGTYIRSLVNDFGQALGSGACLEDLCRTKVGDYSLENAWQLEELLDFLNKNKQLILQDAGIQRSQ